jgi:hypothetical protein
VVLEGLQAHQGGTEWRPRRYRHDRADRTGTTLSPLLVPRGTQDSHTSTPGTTSAQGSGRANKLHSHQTSLQGQATMLDAQGPAELVEVAQSAMVRLRLPGSRSIDPPP